MNEESSSLAQELEEAQRAQSRVVSTVDSKGHARYIRYLLTKKFGPRQIRHELMRLGLSAPHDPVLIKYYLAVIDPLIKKYKLGVLYSDYKGNITTTQKTNARPYRGNQLKFSVDIGDNDDLATRFCSFITDLGIDSIWFSEVQKYYGTTAEIPLNENGERIIKTHQHKRNAENILMFEKRYLIDNLILEQVPDARISAYCKDKLGVNIAGWEIQEYKRTYFNVRAHDIKLSISKMIAEKNALENMLKTIDNDKELENSDIMLIKQKTKQRVSELEESIRTLNGSYSDTAVEQARGIQNDYAKMFEDVLQLSYERFKKLDTYKDRDVVDPLFKITKMMGYTYEKIQDVKESGQLAKLGGGESNANQELLKLYQSNAQDQYEEQLRVMDQLKGEEFSVNDADVDINDIAGIEEIGMGKLKETESED